MLPSSDVLKNDILGLSLTDDKIQGITNLVAVIANYMNQVQGGPTGTPGIFALAEPDMVAILSTLELVTDNSWVSTFADAFQAGCEMAVITPGTVSNPEWLGSGGLDIATSPTGAATITTIAAAVSDLSSQLMDAKPDSDAPGPMAKAIHDATLDFVFTCIGLSAPPALAPIPIPTSAQ